jgi:hypothetical protein
VVTLQPARAVSSFQQADAEIFLKIRSIALLGDSGVFSVSIRQVPVFIAK